MRPRSRLGRSGAAAVEMALLLPILGLLFVCTVDFARLYYHSTIITNCARNGVLYLSDPTAPLESPYPNYTAAALADASDLYPPPTVMAPDYSTPGSVGLTVVYSFSTFTSYPGIPNPVNLTSTVRMRIAPLTPNG